MKKSLLLIGLGLVFLVTQEGFSAKDEPPCNPDGYCYIRNATEMQMFFFDKNHQLINGLVSGRSLRVKDDLFPVDVQTNRVYGSKATVLTMDDPHCYTLWSFFNSKYWTTRWLCSLKNPDILSKDSNTLKSPS